jgi:hypothetical protein
VLQCHGQARPDQLHCGASLSHPGTYIALLPEDARLKVDPACLPRLLSGDLKQAKRRSEASGRPEMRCRGKPLGGSICREAGRGEGNRSLLPTGQRLLPTTLQLKGGSQPTMGYSQPGKIAVPPASIGNLAPSRNCLGQVAGELGVPGQAFQQVKAAALIARLRPQLQSAAGCTLGVSIGVYGAGCLRRRQQCRACLLLPTAERLVLGN